MPENVLRGLIVEDDPLICKDIGFCLEDLGYEPLGPAHTVESALSMLEEYIPDFILLDIDLGAGKNGVELARIINREYRLPFIFLTAFSDDMTLREVKDTLPAGFVLKPFDQHRLKAAIRLALHNYYAVTRIHLDHLEELNRGLIEPLTKREMELLRLLCSGKSNRELARTTFVSINTIKTHLKNLYLKLKVTNRAEAITKVSSFRKGI